MRPEIKTTNEIKLMRLNNWEDEEDFTESDKKWVSIDSEIAFLESINTSLLTLYPELKHAIIREVIQKRIEKLQGDDER